MKRIIIPLVILALLAGLLGAARWILNNFKPPEKAEATATPNLTVTAVETLDVDNVAGVWTTVRLEAMEGTDRALYSREVVEEEKVTDSVSREVDADALRRITKIVEVSRFDRAAEHPEMDPYQVPDETSRIKITLAGGASFTVTSLMELTETETNAWKAIVETLDSYR